MKNFLVISIFATFMLGSCSKSNQNQTITEKRAVTSFNQIYVNVPGLVEVSTGATFSLEIVGDENDLPFVDAVTNGNVLEISFRKTNFNTNLRIKITTPRAIKNIQNVGQATISFLGTTQTPEIFVSLDGSGEIIFQNLETEKLEAHLKGIGSVKIAGKATHEKVTLENSTTFDALQLMADESEINLMGNGSTSVSVKNMLHAHIAGSGTINYKGEPTIFEDITGSGKLVKL
jgi:Putative auto-transporter adhesin, head GIN domain